MGLTRKGSIAALAVALFAVVAGPAPADLIHFDLTNPNSQISPYPAPGGLYGWVNVSLSGQIATFTFVANTGFSLVDHQIADVNVNASAWTLTDLAGLPVANAGLSDADPTHASVNVDDQGYFNQTIDNHGSFGDALTQMSFKLTNTSTTAWSSASDVLIANSDGNFVAAHLAVNSTGPNAITGFVGGSTHGPDGGGGGGGAVPEASTMALLAFGGLPVLFGAIRARKRS